ncbi:SMEK domain-containing protein [Bacillus sp. Brlt_9]|uniref:SMEK domain-containing protein n=1 Tax=Bacillus sp. Brlt_9 TaxID=3110916 RepID=UPI003F7BE383
MSRNRYNYICIYRLSKVCFSNFREKNRRNEGVTIILHTEQLSKSIGQQLIYLAYTLEIRGKLSLFDLHKYCEDFSKHLLNLMYGYNLENLNEQNFNEPGMDLGDKVQKVAIQVTTNKSSAKINETLDKMTDEQKETYEKFIVLILGTKQKTYTIKDELARPVNFTKDNILDITDLLLRINSLTANQMKEVDEFLQSEVIKVYREIDIEDGSGLLKETPTLNFSNCKALVEFIKEEFNADISEKDASEIEEGIRTLMNALISLAPSTREFFYALVIKSEHSTKYDAMCVNYNKMKRSVNLTEQVYNEELRLLYDDDLIKCDDDFDGNISIILSGLCKNYYALGNILDFVNAKSINLEDVLVKCDLSAFAIE